MEEKEHHILSAGSTSDPNSPEFEFWRVRNPSFPQSDLHSADELFSGGILLPLHLLPHHHHSLTRQNNKSSPPPAAAAAAVAAAEPTITAQEQEEAEPPARSGRPEPDPGYGPEPSTALSNSPLSAFTSSKRWKDIILKKSERNSSRNGEDVNGGTGKGKDKGKKKEKKKSTSNVTGGVGNSGVTAAELNIYIWPFRRSRSAGNGGSGPRVASASASSSRKVRSAPCSRSNSAGESKSRKWPSSPSSGGVHLGRTSPVWQLRRATSRGRSSGTALKSAEKGVQNGKDEARREDAASGGAAAGGGGGSRAKARVLNLNVPMCIGYRHHLSCTSDENSAVTVAAAATAAGGQSGGAASADGVRGSNLFNIRSLFAKKVY